KDYYEDLTAGKLRELIGRFSNGEVPVPGPQNGRYASEPLTGLTSLKEHEAGRKPWNASAQRAVDIGDGAKRIDGTEVPLTTPWLGKPEAPAKARRDAAAERGLPGAAGEALSTGKPKVKVAKPAGVAVAAPGQNTATGDAGPAKPPV